MDESEDVRQEERPAPEDPAGQAAVTTGGRALLVYATRHGSTREVADAVAAELGGHFADVDVREAAEAPPPAGYDAVVVGGPMIMGWHRAAERYVKRHRTALAGVPFAALRHGGVAHRGRRLRGRGRPRRQGPLAGQGAARRRTSCAARSATPSPPTTWATSRRRAGRRGRAASPSSPALSTSRP